MGIELTNTIAKEGSRAYQLAVLSAALNQIKIMDRIGTLTSLESLILSNCFDCCRYLNCRLDRGLDRLQNLGR